MMVVINGLWAVVSRILAAIGINTASNVAIASYQKLILLFCFVVVLPIVLKNTILWVMNMMFVLSLIGLVDVIEQQALTYQITSLGGWLANHLNFAGNLAVILTACAARITLRSMRIL